jgi:hypothetical protein
MVKRSARLLLVSVLALSACGRGTTPAGDSGPPVSDWRPPNYDGPPYPGWEGQPWWPDFAPPPRDFGPWWPDYYIPKPDAPPWKKDYYWPQPDYSVLVAEKVTCLFSGSKNLESCYSSKGPSCSGIGSCTVTVTGYPGEMVDWKSSCGGFGTTYLDGKPDTVSFSCGSTVISETVTCLFSGSSGAQTCSASNGASCTGIGSCKVIVSGYQGEQLFWKSTCGASATTTIIDGKPDTITFTCPQPTVTETVTCYFKGSTTYQQCYSSKGTCQGLLGCTISVSGSLGEVVSWKSSCGGYASTTMDGKDENASFYCGGGYDGGPPPPVIPDFGIIPWP